MNPVTYDILTQRVKQLGHLPAMPAILSTLTVALTIPAGKIDLDHISETIGYDKSLTAQILRLANSALFRQRGEIASVRDAVISLGLWRVRDLVFSCSLPMMFASFSPAIGKEVFWRHALGTAVVSSKLGTAFGFGNHHETYLCGLLHDIGVLINCVLFPEDFTDVIVEAITDKQPLEVVEERILGFTHAETGRILAEKWRLPIFVADTIEFHIHPEEQPVHSEVTAIVHAADLFCQRYGLGYGYELSNDSSPTKEQIWAGFCASFPKARLFPEAEYTALLFGFLEEAKTLADHVFCDGVTV